MSLLSIKHRVQLEFYDEVWQGSHKVHGCTLVRHRYFRMCAGWFERGHLNMKQPIVKLAFSTLMLVPVFVLPLDPSLVLILFCWLMVSKAFLTHLADTSRLTTPLKASVLPSDRYTSLNFCPVVAASPRLFSFYGIQESYRFPRQALDLSPAAKTRICAPVA